MHVEFKFRKKTWRACKNPHGFSLENEYKNDKGELCWETMGYYSDPDLMFKRLVKEHLLAPTSQKEIAKTIKETCDKLTKAFVDAVYGSNNA